VPAGNKASLHAYALGVQIYQWDVTKWVFVAPAAALYADPCRVLLLPRVETLSYT